MTVQTGKRKVSTYALLFVTEDSYEHTSIDWHHEMLHAECVCACAETVKSTAAAKTATARTGGTAAAKVSATAPAKAPTTAPAKAAPSRKRGRPCKAPQNVLGAASCLTCISVATRL